MPASRRFDLALDQIATEQKIPSKELRDLLDLYVQRVEADPDAEATDKYYVLMRKQAFDQAAQLAATEGQTAVARMKQQSSRKAAAKAIQENAAAQEKLERQRAIDFYHKEGVACSSAARFENALTAFRNAAALTDEISDPEAWFAEQNQIAMILLDLANYQDAEPLLNALLKSAEKLHGSDSVQSASAACIWPITVRIQQRLL